jgi:four helix bundle protein
MVVRGYQDLLIWQKAMDLAKYVYRLSGSLPRHELYGLASQLQRAAVSVPSNIAEGQSRLHTAEFRQFLYHALGSLAEVDTQLLLAQDFGYLAAGDTAEAEELIVELRKMIHTLVSRLPKRNSRA